MQGNQIAVVEPTLAVAAAEAVVAAAVVTAWAMAAFVAEQGPSSLAAAVPDH